MSRMLLNQKCLVGHAVRGGAWAAVLLLSGCGGKGGGGVRASEPGTPVNTGLSTLDDKPGLALPSEDELMQLDAQKESVQERIAESARQLEFYFTNIEIDGPSEIPEQGLGGHAQAAGGSAPGSASSGITRIEDPSVGVPVTKREQPNPDFGAGDGGGVRVSLKDLAGGSVSDPEPGACYLPLEKRPTSLLAFLPFKCCLVER